LIEGAITALVTELLGEKLIIPRGAPDDSDGPSLEPASAKSDCSEPAQPVKFEKCELIKYTDMQELLLLDPIHEVDETGWPEKESKPST
jgi:hypothetical protein